MLNPDFTIAIGKGVYYMEHPCYQIVINTTIKARRYGQCQAVVFKKL
jgi:hypothetical protein